MDWRKRLESLRPFAGEIRFDEPLAKYVHFRIGGPAAALVSPTSLEDLYALGQLIADGGAPVRILGLGSNLLVPDEGVDALCIRTTKLPAIISHEPEGIRVSAGVTVAALLRRAATEGWDGFEAISGIPGTIGGVVAMNGGTHLGEASDRLLEVRTIDFASADGSLRTRKKEALSFGYRKNGFLGPLEIVVDSLWAYTSGDPARIREKLDALYRRRKETQPLDFPSCGSVFKNPRDSGMRAWEVIDRLGLRGHRIGNAQFAEKHPNWILNLGGARATDVLALIELAKARARVELGVTLEAEVHVLRTAASSSK